MFAYKDLPAKEKEELKKFPAYISLLAANYHSDGLDKKEKKTAIAFTHIETFDSSPLLRDFFKEVEKDFEVTITELDQQLPMKKKEREIIIRNKLNKLEEILKKLGDDYSLAMHKSMQEYKEHVANAHQSLFEYLIFPIPIKGLTY